MTTHDLYLLSPELSMVGLATVLLLLDLVMARKSLILGLGVAGLIVPLGFTVALWFTVGDDAAAENTGVLAATLVVDKFALFFKFLFIGAAAVVGLISIDYVQRFERFRTEFFALALYSATGMMLMAATVELITLYISLELSSLPLVALAAFLRDGRSSEGAMKFLVLGGISSAILLYGMVYVFGFTGTTYLGEIAARIGDLSANSDQPFGSYALLLGIALMIAGFGFKITAVPFQMWAPDVYEGSPTPVTAFLSVASKAAGFAIILRVFYVAFPVESLSIEWSAVFAALAALSMTVGNLVAIAQSNIKRLLAYSTIAHGGYLLVGLAAVASRTGGDELDFGPSGVLFYLAGYAVMNMAAFSVVIAISNRINSDAIADYAGMAKRAPYLAAALAFALLSLTGIPPTVGFIAKVYVFGAAVNAGLEWLVVVGVINSVISAYYYFGVIKVMYLSSPQSDEPILSRFPIRLAVGITTVGVLVFGVYPIVLLDVAKAAAQALFS
ncbi:MAG: NADH-quinone oxidoreductase subunit N [Chloroflexota bacterium]|nr:NADH-quinone oxidoreductase subunit N [Chloroflexota bacterium]